MEITPAARIEAARTDGQVKTRTSIQSRVQEPPGVLDRVSSGKSIK